MHHLIRFASGVLGIVALFSMITAVCGAFGFVQPHPRFLQLGAMIIGGLIVGVPAAIGSDILYRQSQQKPPPPLPPRGFDVVMNRRDDENP